LIIEHLDCKSSNQDQWVLRLHPKAGRVPQLQKTNRYPLRQPSMRSSIFVTSRKSCSRLESGSARLANSSSDARSMESSYILNMQVRALGKCRVWYKTAASGCLCSKILPSWQRATSIVIIRNRPQRSAQLISVCFRVTSSRRRLLVVFTLRRHQPKCSVNQFR